MDHLKTKEIEAFDKCWDVIESSLIKNNEYVSPSFTRRLEILEAMLFGFIESCLNPDSLAFAEKAIFSMGKKL